MWKQRPAEFISKYCSLEGKRVLEVGGGADLEAAQAFIARGAAHVTVTNIGHGIHKAQPTPNIDVRYADATCLSRDIQEQYDVIFGCAVIEHIPRTSDWLAETHKVLRPGGYVYYGGGPIWTCSGGHHIFVNSTDKLRQYRFFNETNPIPSWGHLVYTEQELAVQLQKKGVPDEDIVVINDYVYRSKEINRVPYSDIMRIFHGSCLEVLEVNEISRPISDYMRNLLETRVSPENRYDVSSVEFVLKG